MNEEAIKKIEKDSFFKKYYLHILNIISILSIMFVYFSIFKNNSFGEITLFHIVTLVLNIAFIWGEIIFFIIKAAKMADLKYKILKIFLIYEFSWIYIPVFYSKYIDKNVKKKSSNIFYIILSSILLIILCFYIVISILSVEKNIPLSTINNTYTDSNNTIQISIPDIYNKDIPDPYDMYFKNNVSVIGLFLYDNSDLSATEVLDYHSNDILSKRNNIKLIDDLSIKKDGKNTISKIYKYELNNRSYIVNVSAVTFDEKENYVIFILQNCIESTYEDTYKNIFPNILDSIQLVK